MAEFIFDLQRFDSSGSGSSGGGSSSSGGSNAKTDGNTTEAATSEVWSDGFQTYSTLQINTFANDAYALLGTVSPDEYVATVYGDNITVDTFGNNIIYNADRFDTINFTATNLEDLADIRFVEGGGYYDLIFNKGTLTRIYSTDTEFTPTLNFASGLSEVYSYDLNKTWFSTEDLQFASQYWNNLSYYVGTDDVYDAVLASRSVNNLLVLGDEDEVFLYDTSVKDNDISSVKATDSTINFLFNNGTGTLIRYSGTFSPTIYQGSGETFVYNSKMGAWRTPDEAVADAAQYVADELQKQADDAAKFNVVYDTTDDIRGSYTPFVVSRFANTMIYNTYSNNDIYFNDAVSGNVVGVVQEDDFNFDIVFDTGDLTKIQYWSTVSPSLHFADGTDFAYNWATKEMCKAYSGTNEIVYDYELDDNGDYVLGDDGQPIITGFRTRYTENDIFTLSRADNSFVNKVTANDDIYLGDTTVANITDSSIIGGYAISLNFDTGTNLRVQDATYISPIFNLGDGTAYAYNWITDNWATAYKSTEEVAESVALSSANNSFIRNADDIDTIYITDATAGNIANIFIDYRNEIYINLAFDNGASTAISCASDYSPVVVFADGSRYRYNWQELGWETYTESSLSSGADLAESADLWGDTVADDLFVDGTIAADATLSDLIAAPVDNAAISFNADSFDINAADGFVAPSAVTKSIRKDV